MSNKSFKQLAIAGAVAAVFSAPFAAHALSISPTSPSIVPSNIFKTATQTISNQAAVAVNVGGSDVFLGRTTGFNVVITLTGGAKFSGDPVAPTTGTACSGWTVTKAGGGDNTSSITYSVQPTGTTGGVVQGSCLNFAVNTILLKETGLGTTGNVVGMTATVNDPVGGGTLGTTSQNILTSVAGVDFSISGTTTSQRIDVGTGTRATPTGGTAASKTMFSSDGTIRKLDSVTFSAGSFTITARTTAGCAGQTLASANCTPGGGAAGDTFGFSGTDSFVATVAGTDLTPFLAASGGQAYLVSGAGSACSGGTILASAVAGTSSGALITFSGVNFTTVAGGSYTVCLKVADANTKVIQAQNLTLTVNVDFADADVTDVTGLGGALARLDYNGTVRNVYFVNPGSNTTQRSILRIVNPGSTDGKVNITGTTDGGVVSPTISFTLQAGKGVQYNIQELEGSVGVGAGKPALSGTLGQSTTGKWALLFSGEFANMQVISYLQGPDGTNTNMSNTTLGPTIQNGN